MNKLLQDNFYQTDEIFKEYFNNLSERLSTNIDSVYECFTINENVLNNAIKDNDKFNDATKTELSKFLNNYILVLHYHNISAVTKIIFNCEPGKYYIGQDEVDAYLNYYSDIELLAKSKLNFQSTRDNINGAFSDFHIYDSYKTLYNNMVDVFKDLNRTYENFNNSEVFKGGYKEKDVDIFTKVLLSGLIDVVNMPYNSYDEVIGEKTYESAIVTAGKLLNSIKDFKIKANISNDIFNPLTCLDPKNTIDIYDYLQSRIDDKSEEIDDKLYLFPPNETNNIIRHAKNDYNYNASIYKSLWNRLGNKKLSKQLQPMFILFDNSMLDNNDRIDMNIGNIRNLLHINPDFKDTNQMLVGLMEAIKIMFYRNKSLSKDIHNMRTKYYINQFSNQFDRFKAYEANKETNTKLIGIPGFLNAWYTGYDFIDNYKVFDKEPSIDKNKKVILGGYIGVLGSMMSMNKVVSMIVNIPYEDKISILKGIYLAVYIKARMHDAPNIFRDQTGIRTITYVNDISYTGMIDKVFSKNTFILNNGRKYEKPKVSYDIISRYLVIRPEKQPILTLSKYDFMLRDTHSIFGAYSLLNPYHNLLNCSWNCLIDELNIDTNKINIFGTNSSLDLTPVYKSIKGSNNTYNRYLSLENAIIRYSREKRLIPDVTTFMSEINGTIGPNEEAKICIIPTNYYDTMNDNGSECYVHATGDDVRPENDNNQTRNMNNTGSESISIGPEYIKKIFEKFNLTNSKNVNDKYKTFDEQIRSTIDHPDLFYVDTDFEDKEMSSMYNDFNKLNNTLWTIDNSPTSIGMKIIEDTISGVEHNMVATRNTGFSDNMFAMNSLTGGSMVSNYIGQSITYSNGNGFIREYINNPEEPFSGITPIETYSNIYKDITNDSNTHISRMFSNMFKFTTTEKMSCEYMFALIINYFHKYTVSFNSIYNQVLFPSIIYNSAVYSTIATKYSEVFGDSVSNTNAFTKFARSYLNMAANSGYFDEVFNYDERNTVGEINKDTEYTSLALSCEHYNNNNNKAVLSVQNMPSINNKFLSLLFSKGLIGESDTDGIFRKSTLLSTIKRSDAVETYIFVILLINKYMSYYNIDSNTDVPYSGNAPQNPFGYRLDI